MYYQLGGKGMGIAAMSGLRSSCLNLEAYINYIWAIRNEPMCMDERNERRLMDYTIKRRVLQCK